MTGDHDPGSTCRSCGARVEWATHIISGKLMPLEPYVDAPAAADDGALFVEPRGAFVMPQRGWYRAANVGDDGLMVRYQSHFATCPQAQEWRDGPRPAGSPAARAGDPETSHEAAATVTTGTVMGTRERILSVLLAARRPLTDQDIADRVGEAWPTWEVSPSGLRTRRSELEADKLLAVVDNDGRTTAGRRCRRYGITALGRQRISP